MRISRVIRKLIAADDARISRFHDGEGKLVAVDDLIVIPKRLVQNFQAKKGVFANQPWWPPKATVAIEGVLQKDWDVLEFGSGMSSLWLARRVGRVTSIEHNVEWSSRVLEDIKKQGLSNIEVLVRDRETYLDTPDRMFDFVIVDAIRRADCVRWALKHVKPGGYIYLDNSDIDKDDGQEGVRNLARQTIIQAASAGAGDLRFFRGYPPAQLAPTEGALLQVKP